jgi:polyhydroxyalkanoate synthesis repressor PhaR
MGWHSKGLHGGEQGADDIRVAHLAAHLILPLLEEIAGFLAVRIGFFHGFSSTLANCANIMLTSAYRKQKQHPCEESMSKKPQNAEPIVIKKYANRRLYNTDTSTYVTLDDLCTMVKEGADFIVYDAKSGEDLTRQILTQIIFEQESQANGEHLMPINFLRSLIGYYDNSLKGFVPHYLESTMQAFQGNQGKMHEMLGMGNMGSFGQVAAQLEEIGKQNMEMFTKAFSMFTSFSAEAKKK